MSQLLRYDAVTFLTLLEGVRLSQGGNSIWLFHEATHFMYEQVCWGYMCVCVCSCLVCLRGGTPVC